jgi:hypothetical protein
MERAVSNRGAAYVTAAIFPGVRLRNGPHDKSVYVVIMPDPPDLAGFTAYCETCGADRTVHMARETHAHRGIEGADRVEPTASTETVYHEYRCDDCDSILLTIAEVKSPASS